MVIAQRVGLRLAPHVVAALAATDHTGDTRHPIRHRGVEGAAGAVLEDLVEGLEDPAEV